MKSFLKKIDAMGSVTEHIRLQMQTFLPFPLNRLTERQRNVLITAYREGYYNLPRGINSKQLAKKLASATLIEDLRKTEQRLIRQLLT